MDSLKSVLPEGKGILPYYMFVLSVISIGNCLQTYSTLHFSRRLYNGRLDGQLTPLAGRIFGTWTLITSIVRCYAAYNLHLGPVYNIAYWTYVVAFGHFFSEKFVFGSMTFGLPQVFPFTLATCALIWMPLVRDYYVTVY
ncbi:hypothetical protein UVI_02059340 [Ustilaginoidea virens]|uniref:Ergosterol biosynthesis protein n=1 Tax=Ustilaginoidea virens TaxID=1159556 RepID=A0A1B5L5Y7_USTVR|nr:hypothetical protein UVI_02059340 [Ustilaginoidea virens]